jgi:hypothetical protein
MESFPASKVMDSTAIEASGRTVAYFDFCSDVYNMLFFFSLDGALVLGSFECLIGDFDDWKPVFIQMLCSIEKTEQSMS